jgi:hypothetical protein
MIGAGRYANNEEKLVRFQFRIVASCLKFGQDFRTARKRAGHMGLARA